jgi:hypothetical protein
MSRCSYLSLPEARKKKQGSVASGIGAFALLAAIPAWALGAWFGGAQSTSVAERVATDLAQSSH